MKITFEATIEEIKMLLQQVDTTETKLDGYDVEQYEFGEPVVTVHQGFKIYISDVYFLWMKGNTFNDRTSLRDTVDECMLEIDDHVIRMNK